MEQKEFYARLAKATYRYDGYYARIAKAIKRKSANYIWVLYAIDYYGLRTQIEIAEEWDIPLTTVNSIIKEMKKEGIINLRPNEKDKREKLIFLTENGEALAKDILSDLYAKESKIYEKLENPELLLSLYEKLVEEAGILEDVACFDIVEEKEGKEE